MTSNRLKNLAKCRLILSVIAVLLAGLMIVSGIMHFRPPKTEPSVEEPTESTTETVVTTTAETTAATETTTSTEATEETTEPPTEATQEDITLQPEQAGAIKKPPKDSEIADTDLPHQSAGDHDASDSESDNDHKFEPGGNTGGNPAPEVDDDAKNNFDTNTGDSSEGDQHVGDEVVHSDDLRNASLRAVIQEIPEPSSAVMETTEVTSPVETTAQTEPSETIISPAVEEEPGTDAWGILFWTSAALLAADLLAILVISKQIQNEQERLRQNQRGLSDSRSHTHHANQAASQEHKSKVMRPIEPTQLISTIPQVASIHQVGRRDYQQDSLGHSLVLSERGMLAVLADGMGGLANGEKVSQKIVLDALAIGSQLTQDQVNGCLWKMVEKINDNANRMLGSDGLYKSGSTLVAVLSYANHFQWISVGDSRIYLYRKGYANQLNQDHDQLQVLMADVLSGRLTTEEALRNPDGRKLTSFIGMGQLKHVDGSQRAIALESGDRLILMSDGIYTIIGEDRLADILTRYPDVNQAASVIERTIRDSNHPQQDNYTAIILGF